MINLVEPKKKPSNRFWGRDYPARRSPCRIEIGLTVVKVESVSVLENMVCVGNAVFCSAVSAPPNMWPSGQPVWNSGLDTGTFRPAAAGFPNVSYVQSYPSETKGDVTITARLGSSEAPTNVTFVRLVAADIHKLNALDHELPFSLEPSATELGVTPTASSDNSDIDILSVDGDSVQLSVGDASKYNDAGNRNALNGATITINAGPCIGSASVRIADRLPIILEADIPGTLIASGYHAFNVIAADFEDLADARFKVDAETWASLFADIDAIIGLPPTVTIPGVPSAQRTTSTVLSNGSQRCNGKIGYPLATRAVVLLIKSLAPSYTFDLHLKVTPFVAGVDGYKEEYTIGLN